MKSAVDQVKSGAIQISDVSQNLSQGATEQAASIEELQSSISNVSENVDSNISDVKSAVKYAEKSVVDANESNDEMLQTLNAMKNIAEVSNNINKVLKVIDDIAFQTNILALNAAVEASHAGAAGKGFAVVAEEVKNLAAKSAQAANQTANLISDSIRVVENGSKKAENTAKVLNSLVDYTRKIKELMLMIDKSASEQAIAIKQINVAIDQISTVTQVNSATAQESAAASEELSGQSIMLQKEIEKFKLNETLSYIDEIEESK